MRIPLTQGFEAEIDDEDGDLVSGYTWCARRTFNTVYAITNVEGRTVYMHRLIMNDPAAEVDHEDRNGLNNQRSNLRLASRQQNQVNSGPRSGKYKGVTTNKKQPGKWIAQIKVDSKVSYLGAFDTPEDAANAYDTAARSAWGDRAYQNFPERTHSASM